MKLKTFDRRRLGVAAGLALTGLLIAELPAADSPVSFNLDDFPAPPDPLRALLDRGPLKWETGLRKEDEKTSDNQKKVAETAYRIKYSYNCRTNWIVDRLAGTVTIKVRYSRIEWSPEHTIWLETLPEPDEFWSQAIVLHELDHLRISSDPRVKVRFEQRLRAVSVLVRSIPQDAVVNQSLVNRLVQEHVVDIFEEYSDLIAIRYKELDRITSHGQRPVPADSQIAKLLVPDS